MKPILFNTEMVRAILDGRKTVTRRVLKPVSKKACGFSIVSRNDGKGNFVFEDVYDADDEERMFDSPQRRFRVGDILYVRETYAYSHDPNDEYFIYKADGEPNYPYYGKELSSKKQWLPSIHMPKEAARIFLKVTDVRVERLQDMSEQDAIKEGVQFDWNPGFAFMILWDSTIKKTDLNRFSWMSNPLVWVIKFERCEKEVE